MAWTAPASYTTNEVVTAAKLNTHIRDNLTYLKGGAGQIGLDSDLVITNAGANRQLTMVGGATIKSYLGVTGGSLGLWDINRSPVTGTFDDAAKAHARIGLDGSGAASFIQLNTANAANTLASERVRIDGAGNVGIGTTAPKGRLHVVYTNGNMAFVYASGITGTTNILANGTVTKLLQVYGICNNGGGGAISGIAVGVGAGGLNTNSDTTLGGDTFRIAISAGGQVDFKRQAGSGTLEATALLIWI